MVLTQVTPGGKAEINTKSIALAGRINLCLKESFLEDPPTIRALRKVHRTGEIILQFTKPDHAQRVQDQWTDWVPLLNHDLCLKKKFYTIMVHGVTTSFNTENKVEIQDLKDENPGLSSSLQSVRWANTHPISISKTFSYIFISLSHP